MAAALAWLVSAALASPRHGLDVRAVSMVALHMLTLVGVPLAGAWLVSRLDARRSYLGLAGLAAWGALVGVPRLFSTLAMLPERGVQPRFFLEALLPSALTVAVLLVALTVLRARHDDRRSVAAAPHRAAGAAIAVWALVSTAPILLATRTPGLGLTRRIDLLFRDPEVLLAGLLPLLILVTMAALVWRRDRLDVVALALVVAVEASTRAARIVAMTLTTGDATGVPLRGVDSHIAALAQVVVAAVLVVVALRLALRAREAATAATAQLRRLALLDNDSGPPQH